MTDIADILIELCTLDGPSGFETAAAERIRTLLEPYADETYTDVLGNVAAVRRCGRENAKRLLFDAHIDEIGLIATGCQDGFIKFAALGSPDARLLPASPVKILTSPPLPGVICELPPHVAEKDEKTPKIEDMFIDAGMTREEAERAIQPGTPIVLASGARRFGDGLICGKALDDRAGIAAILYALELLKDEKPDVDLYVMASVQEEVGVRGAAPGAYTINPDLCVVIDADFAGTPDIKPGKVSNELGGGVVVSRGPNMNRAFTEMAVNLARENGIRHQISVEPGGNSGTNARAIQVTREGVATALLGIPVKYMHSANETASLGDIECTARLLCEIAKRIGGDRLC